jgi:elongation factor P
MDMNTYEQVEISKAQIGDEVDLLKENLTVDIMFFEGEMLGMNLPDKIELKVTHTEPAVKGNTTSSAMKDATLETGKVIKVPLFIEQDEVILVSSKDGKYVSRA